MDPMSYSGVGIRSPFRSAVCRTLPVALLGVLALLLVLTSLEKHLTYDELPNLFYGRRFLAEGPGVGSRSGGPVVALSALPRLHNLSPGWRLRAVDADEVQRLLVRMPTMGFALGLGVLLYWWVGEALGPAAARLTLALYVFNPTILAHGKQVTGDLATAFFTTGALFAAWRFARWPSRAAFLWCVASTAGAALSKYSALYLLLVIPALVASCAWRDGQRLAVRRVLRWAGVAVAFVVGVLFLINAVYRFDGTLRSSAEITFKSRAIRQVAAWGLPMPVPVGFVRGIDRAADAGESADSPCGSNYVLGRLSTGTTWYAFPLMLLLKTPLAFFVLAGIGLAGGLRRESTAVWRFWLVPALVHLALFSLGVKWQIGIRYLLPAVVLLLPLAGAAARAPARVNRVLVLALTGWYVVSALSYYPHPMCYFNELIGRRIHAYRYLADSNLDWEDRSADIARYRLRHKELDITVEPVEPRTGYVLVGANRLLGLLGDDNRYAYLRRLEPMDHVGYSFLLFHVAPGDLPSAGRHPPSPAP
jgi:hypothetical protein